MKGILFDKEKIVVSTTKSIFPIIKEYVESSFTIGKIDFDFLTEIFDSSINIKNVLIQFYQTVEDSITKKIEAVIENDSLSLLDLIKINGKNVTIVKIQPDNDSLLTKIEAWG